MQIFANQLSLFKSALTFASISMLTIATPESGNAADIILHNTWETIITDAGACSHQHVLSRAKYHFAYQVRHVPDLPHLQIKSFSNIMQTRYEPAVTHYNITRHYCTAIANMDNGASYPVAYVVSENQGFAGMGGINVNFCVEGFDKWRVYNNACRSLK